MGHHRIAITLALLALSMGCEGQLTVTGGDGSTADAGASDAFTPSDGATPDGPAMDGGASDAGAAVDAMDAAALDVGRPDGGPCSAGCGAGQVCLMDSCTCAAGYAPSGGACLPEEGTDPLTHTQADVCARWQASAESSPGFTEGAAMCDPGTLSTQAIFEGMARIQFYRWLTGLTAASTAESHVEAQHCALVSSWNPAGPAAHRPTPDAVCYTPEGAAGAGSSNIAWGSRTTVAAIDQWVQDRGNATTMGHRRWILNPPLSNVKLGLYRGGTSYGGAACMGVFGRGGMGRRPDWVAFPPPGVSPVGLPASTWTFHAGWSFGDVSVQVTRMSDGADLPVTILPLSGGFGQNATSWVPEGWSREAGETYEVTVTAGANNATYQVLPVDC